MMPGAVTAQNTHAVRHQVVYPQAARDHDSLTGMRVPLLQAPAGYHAATLPALVDNSKKNCWPGMQDQYMFYTCQQYAGVNYVFGYEINRLRNKTGWLWENRYPAHYTWNFMNEGERFTGVNFLQSFEVIRQQGEMTMNDYGEDTATSVLGWISGYDKYYRGMPNRLKQVYAIEMNSAAGISMLKNYLYDHLEGSPVGGIACFTTSSEALYGMKLLPPGTPEAGKNVIFDWLSNPNHGLTVVGYNDSVRYDVNHDGIFTNTLDITGDGIVDACDWEIGGFKIANTYGNWWADTGFAYALYRSFAFTYGHDGGVWNNRVYVVEADTGYRPLLTMKVSLEHSARNKIRILAGVSSDTLHQAPDHVIDFPIFNFQGGEHAMRGNDTVPSDKSIEFGLDVTQLLNFVPSGQPARYFLMVEEKDPYHIGQGRILQASFISYRGTQHEVPVNATGVTIRDNNTTLVSAVASFTKPLVQITTGSLPSFNPPQPLQVQLQASGGTPPYSWSFLQEYAKKPTSTPQPLITGASILQYDETRSFTPVALPFSFPFYGKQYDSIYVNYFGFIAFERQHLPGPYITDEMGMLRSYPLIVPSFSQKYAYQFNKNDGIWFQQDAGRVIIRWKVSVAPYYTTSTDDFSVILYADGRIEYCYGTMENYGFVHTFFKGLSRGDDLNYDLQRQWNADEISGKSFLFYPPVVPGGLTLSKTGLLTVTQADSSTIYGLKIAVSDAGRISDSKELLLSDGLEMTQELQCDGDDRLKAGKQASLKLTLKNTGTQPLMNTIVKIAATDSSVVVTDSLYSVALINPGQSVTVPSAFSFRLRHALPNGYPVKMALRTQAGTRNWAMALTFPVAAPEVVADNPYISDGYNNMLDPGEIADLFVKLSNNGGVAAHHVQLTLVSDGPDVSVLSGSQVTIDNFDIYSSSEVRFQVKALKTVLAGSEAAMHFVLKDTTGVLQAGNFTLQIGTRSVGVVNLASSQTSCRAMARALDSLHVGYDTLFDLSFGLNRYASIFLILGTASTGTHPLTEVESSTLASYLMMGGNLYMESYQTWYYLNQTLLHPMFKYTSKKIPAYYYPNVRGVHSTFTDSMAFTYTAPMKYAVFSFEPVAPAYATLVNSDNPPKNLEVVYDGDDYKTIGTMLDFSALNGGASPSTQRTLMQRYLEFFKLNLAGPYPLFHAGDPHACIGQAVGFTDDSFDNITSRTWEFQGGTPATSHDAFPSVNYFSPGKYDVKLTVSDGKRTMSILKQQYIQADHCSGTGEITANKGLFSIFPNPAGDRVTVELSRNISGSCTIALLDIAGKKIMETHQTIPGNNHILLELGGLEKGLYFISVHAGGYTSTLKLIKN
jgi:hypothetical protein